jgi:hypothetical protein
VVSGNPDNSVSQKYDKQDQQGKAAFNERNPYATQQQELVAKSPGGPQTKPLAGINNKRWHIVAICFKTSHYSYPSLITGNNLTNMLSTFWCKDFRRFDAGGKDTFVRIENSPWV